MSRGVCRFDGSILQSGLASAERVFELLDAAEESVDPQASDQEDVTRGRVAFEDVTFSYLPERPLLEELSFVAHPGETVAIVGPTGAGKTTLVNLLMRFYEVQGGRITLDGRDTRSMPRHQLRSQIGMVLQDTWLFEGTIRDNIRTATRGLRRGHRRCRPDRLRRPVRPRPSGRLRHPVDDSGGAISAGEKQLSPSPGPSSPTPPFSCSTRPRPRSTPVPRCWSRRPWPPCAATGRASSSRIDCRPSGRPTPSWSWNRARLSSRGTTTP